MIATLNFPTLLKFPLGGAQEKLERVAREGFAPFRRMKQRAANMLTPLRGGLTPLAVSPSRTILIADTYTAADATNNHGRYPETHQGSAWAEAFGSGRGQYIFSNTLRGGTFITESEGSVIDCGKADIVMTVDMKVMPPTSSGQGGVLFRYTDANNYLWLFVDTGNSIKMRLKKREGGVNSDIATSSTAIATGAFYPLTVTLIGSSISVNWQGVTLTANSSFNLTATKHGTWGNLNAADPNQNTSYHDNLQIVG